jgi:hypothetical protein
VRAVGSNVTQFRPGDEVFGKLLAISHAWLSSRQEMMAVEGNRIKLSALWVALMLTYLLGMVKSSGPGVGDLPFLSFLCSPSGQAYI